MTSLPNSPYYLVQRQFAFGLMLSLSELPALAQYLTVTPDWLAKRSRAISQFLRL